MYDAATGVWQYNWQTMNVMSGKRVSVKLTLNMTGRRAFQFVK